MSSHSSTVARGSSRSSDPRVAVRELHAAIGTKNAALVVVFCSPGYDLDVLGPALREAFAPIPVIGATTAGEIGPDGYMERSLVGVSLGSADFRAHTVRIDAASQATSASGERAAHEAALRLHNTNGGLPGDAFALLLCDGLCMREEALASGIHRTLGVPLAGGSAADGTRFAGTRVFVDGAFRSDVAVLALVETRRSFVAFKAEHFVASGAKMVVTEAIPASRAVSEIDGEPAAVSYARAVGVPVSELGPTVFATHPVVVRVGGTPYVRSINRLGDDGTLHFFCAIDRGVVLTPATSVDLVRNLEDAFVRVESMIGSPDVVFGFDCILRKIEIETKGIADRVSDIMRRRHVVGFATYGEQIGGIHVNHTFSGIAIGGRRPHAA